jgi:DNA (cytosine-5-)-methyltransferase
MTPIKVIDLFSGAGGLSYGFEQVGAKVVLAIEKDAWAVDTYKANHRNQNVLEADINELENDFFEQYKGNVDIVMGGPPCQGFSIAASNRRKMDDSRNVLYRQFLRVVDVVSPKVVLIENVKEIVNYKLPDGTKIIEDII